MDIEWKPRFIVLPWVFVCAVVLPRADPADAPLLEHDVLPILTRNCMGCHGGLHQRGGLDLRTLPAMLKGGESGPAIEPGSAEKSELWRRIASNEMPAGDDREKLSVRDRSVIKSWIDAGIPTVSERQSNADPLLAADRPHSPADVAAAIDQQIDAFLAAAKMQPAAVTDDAEFLRRVTLDLTGCVPTATQAAQFLDSRDSHRRKKLIDRLLETQAFGAQFGRTWREWVCPPELPSTGNAGDQPHRQAKEFGNWLGRKVFAGQPWDRITRDILTARGEIEANPQIIFFALVGQDSRTTADGSARAAASLFMGVQLQCARCHDDPYRDWSQQEHWSLAAFFARSQGDFKKVEVGKGPSELAGEITIPESAFRNAGTIVPAAFPDGESLAETQIDDLRSPFVDWLVDKSNPFFARAFANRIWFYLFSRGIVHPVDDLRDLNPPSHPGLMSLLAGEFVASDYDIRHLFRCICNSQAYQRSSRIEPEIDELARDALTTAFGRMPLRVMTADMLYDSLRLAYGDSGLDLRTQIKHTTVGMSAAVADPYLEFQRRFGTNEEDTTDFTHGVAQMLTMINHPRLLAGSQALDAEFFPEYLKLPSIESRRNEDLFPAVRTRYVRFTVEKAEEQPCLDELEVHAPGRDLNLALASTGAVASASSVLPGYDIHQVSHLNDGKHGNAHSWVSNEDGSGWAQIRLPSVAEVSRVVWGRDREGKYQDRLAQQYRIEVSMDGQNWKRVSDSSRRNGSSPVTPASIARPEQVIEWLYLSTLSRRPTREEAVEALEYARRSTDRRTSLGGVLWMLVNRSEYILVR